MNATQTLRCQGEYQDENNIWRCSAYYDCRYKGRRENCPDLNRYLLEHKSLRTPTLWETKYGTSTKDTRLKEGWVV